MGSSRWPMHMIRARILDLLILDLVGGALNALDVFFG